MELYLAIILIVLLGLISTIVIINRFSQIKLFFSKNYKKIIAVSAIALISTGVILTVPTGNPPADETDDNWWVYPDLPPGQIFAAPTFNWNKFWSVFKEHAFWSLEGYNNDNQQWEYYNDSLTVEVTEVGNNGRKLNLVFDAPADVTTDYRLTLTIDYFVKQYVHKIDKYTYNLSFEVNGESFNVSYNFSDIASIPGIIINHGVTDDYFWFRARRNNVDPDTHIELDPTYTVFAGAGSIAYLSPQRKLVRQSNGTLWCTFAENDDVHMASSEDDGATWNDREIWGAQRSRDSTIAVDSNDVVHLIFSSEKNDANNWQLEYTNSTDWTTIVQVKDEDKNFIVPAIAIDSTNDIHIVYDKSAEGASNDNQVAYINSTDNGESWGTEQILTNEPDNGDDTWYVSIAIDTNDIIHVIFEIENYFNGKESILHMESNDYGDTWSGWDADVVYQDANFDQKYPCIAIDDNNELHVIWYGDNQNTKDQIGWSYNDSSGWSNAIWVTWDATKDYQYPTIGVNDNNFIHAAYEVVATRLDHSVNNTATWTDDVALTGDFGSPNMISTQWPVVGGVKTNRPDTGYAFICSFSNTNITYHDSADLAWEVSPGNPPVQTTPRVWDGTTNHTYNGTCVRFPPSAFYITINDPEGNKMNVTIMTNYGSKWEIVNQTSGIGLTNGTYGFRNISWVDTCNTTYNLIYNVTDGINWRNVSHTFITVNESIVNDMSPVNNSIDMPLDPTLDIYANDSCGLNVDVYWYENTSGAFLLVNSDLNVGANTRHTYVYENASHGSTEYHWRVAIDNGYCNLSYTFKFTTEYIFTKYSETIRNDGEDFFTWLGNNTTAWYVAANLTNFDEAAEYISIWNLTTWSATHALWEKYYGDGSGANFTVNTFDIVHVYLTDSGTQTFDMCENIDINYTNSKSVVLTNLTKNKGNNYSTWNKVAATTLSDENATIGLSTGQFIALWNETNYWWDYYFSGFGFTDSDILQWDVVKTCVSQKRTWVT